MPLTSATSPYDVSATVERVLAALQRRGIQVFSRIDHAGGARAAGLEMPDEEVVIFGDPRVGTLLMQSDPAVGYELPLRLLVWDAAGQTAIGYRPASKLADDFDLESETAVLGRMDQLLEQIVAESIAPE